MKSNGNYANFGTRSPCNVDKPFSYSKSPSLKTILEQKFSNTYIPISSSSKRENFTFVITYYSHCCCIKKKGILVFNPRIFIFIF